MTTFTLADDLVPAVYAATKTFPPEERYGLQSQIRRAAVSIPTNIVEGCARHSQAEYVQFLNIAHGSAAELLYLLGLSRRLEILPAPHSAVVTQAESVKKSLNALIRSLA